MKNILLVLIVAILSLSLYSQNSNLTYGDWSSTSDLNLGRKSLGVVAVNGKLYAIGGRNSNDVYQNTIEEYNPTTDKWTHKANMNNSRNGYLAVESNMIYAMAGADGTTSGMDKCEVYDPTTNTWTEKTSMSYKRKSPAVAAYDGKVYVIGGVSTTGVLKINEIYNISSDSWSTGAALPVKTYGAACVQHKGKIYVLGGSTGTDYLKDIRVYNIQTNSWSKLASMPGGRRYPAAAVYGDSIFVMGGTNGTSQSNFYKYDINNDQWETLPNMPYARAVHGAAVLDHKLYVVSGAIGKDIYKSCDVMELDVPSGIESDITLVNSVYPNPFTNEIIVKIENNQNQNYHICIIDLNGKEICSHLITNENQIINTSDLLAGTYIIQIKSADHFWNHKLFKLE